MFRNLGAMALAASMFASSTAFAATDVSQGALAQGKPASVKQAQSFDNKTLPCLLLGAGVVIGGIALIATGNGHGAVGSTTTCPLGKSNCPPPQPVCCTTTTTTTTTH
ncbi:MAG: hypothetical protein ABSD21_04350 [Rhizomicrobium sp.]|jgi:hypothetical protein